MSSHQQAIERQVLADALLQCGPWNCRHDDDALIEHARAQARAVEQDAAALHDPVIALQRATRRAELHHIDAPEGYGAAGALARLSCSWWWRRQLRRLTSRRREQRQRVLGRVHLRDGIYVSNEGLAARRDQQARNAAMLDAMVATNQDGQEYTLAELAELGLANPNNRRAELMLRIADTEAEAQRLGHVGLFLTLTCPSRFHPVIANPFRINRKYAGSTPREAQAHLQKQWAKCRAKLARAGLGIYGIRVVEPHHDGTPHWHLLLWMQPGDVARVTREIRDYAYEIDRDELRTDKARRARFDVKRIDHKRGSAAGYVAKYISKNINGEQFKRGAKIGDDLDHYGQPLDTSAPRIEAWAATWGIRQFQFFGLPSVTVWREARRITEKQLQAMADWEEATRPEPEAAAIMDELRRACDAGHWHKFLRLMGGPMTPRAEQPVRPWRLIRQGSDFSLKDAGTGELTLDALGRYGDAVPACFGLVVNSAVGSAEYLTRFYRWDVAPKGESNAVDFERLSAAKSPWTRVNNCTHPEISPSDRSPLTDYEFHVTASFQRMNPPVTASRLAEARQKIASDAYHYETACLIRQEKAAAARRRARLLEKTRQAFDAMLAAGEITPDEWMQTA